MKATAIMVKARGPLSRLPPDMRAVLSVVLFQWFEGLDEENDQAWKRMWGDLYHTREEVPVLSLYLAKDRSGAFHHRHMAIEGRIFDHQEPYAGHQLRAFRDWLKTGAAFGTWESGRFTPSSLSYDECSDAEMRTFHKNAMAFLHTPAALAHLFPACPPEKRDAMLEALIQPPPELP